jgi:hypothetical protein
MAKRSILVCLAFAGLLTGACSQSGQYVLNIEGTGAPPAPPTDTTNPFVPPGGGTAPGITTDKFDQKTTAAPVDIIWMIDSSGSMENNQNEIRTNAAAFTNQLTNANVDFHLIVVTSDPSNDSMVQNRCPEIIDKDHASDFANCAVVGSDGSGHEEGLEAVRRALDPEFPNGPWNTAAAPSPRNPDFLRANADLHVIYVSDEEDQPDGASWTGKAGVDAADVAMLRQEMTLDLSDNGHGWDRKYKFIPFAASHSDVSHSADPNNHVAFLRGLKTTAGTKVRAHAIVTNRLDGSDDCHTRTQTEEVGQRYIAVANLLGGSVTDICSDWSTTMSQIGLKAAGLEQCFALKFIPTDRGSIVVTVDGNALASGEFQYVVIGNQVCLKTVPAAGAHIEITYQ